MTYAKVSPKYQVVIPKEVREGMDIKSGQRLIVMAKGNVIYLIPEATLGELKGRYKGIDIESIREEDERI